MPGTDFLIERAPELWMRLGEHMVLTGVPLFAAVLLGVPLGILAARYAPLRGGVLGSVGILQTIPSLAMLALLLVLLGQIGKLPAIIALALYALLPVVQNTLTGLQGVDPRTLEAADGLGMTRRQRLWRVELPLAMPVMLAGVRTAAVITVGIATLSALIGAGGLGQFIIRGLALNNGPLIWLGVVPSAALALLVYFALAAAEWSLRPLRQSERGTWRVWARPVGLSLPAALVVLGFVAATVGAPDLGGGRVIRIGGKNFTEQLILGEILAQSIENQTDHAVRRQFSLGGTMICHEALVRGEIDLYVEYTGTALTAVLDRAPQTDSESVYRQVAEAYDERFGLTWMPPLGFENTYALAVRASDAKAHGWETISDLSGEANLRAGFTAEFMERPDGFPGLRKAYGLSFASAVDLEPALMYEALARDQVDVIGAFSTDGRIRRYKLRVLRDDKRYFPPYQAAPVVRAALLEEVPAVRGILQDLAGRLDDTVMRRLNHAVDVEGRSPAEVARRFLEKRQAP